MRPEARGAGVARALITGLEAAARDAGNDTIFAGPGVDIVFGGSGDDTIFARAKVDVAAPGADTVFAGPGNDTVFVRDGEPDVVSCGSGTDVVFADPTDVTRPSCERVHVGEPKPNEDLTEEVGDETAP